MSEVKNLASLYGYKKKTELINYERADKITEKPYPRYVLNYSHKKGEN